MKRPRFALMIMLVCVLTVIWAQAAFPQAPSKASSTAKAAPKPTAPPAQALSQAESFEMLNTLNEDEKLIPESYIMPLTKHKDLRVENCSGVRLANGKRLAGESGGKSYGMRGFKMGADGKEETTFVMVGLLYAEFPFSINNHSFPAGPYMVHAYKDALELSGNAETGTRYDMQRRKDVPLSLEEKLPFKAALPDAFLAEKATDIPRFTLAVEKGSIVLALEGNTWKVQPR
jgi:hypothetical protein